jgi:hypothetical protein
MAEVQDVALQCISAAQCIAKNTEGVGENRGIEAMAD